MPRMRRRMMPIPYPVKTKNQHSLKLSVVPGVKNAWTIIQGTKPGTERVDGTTVPAGNHVYRLNFAINAIHASGSGSGDFDFYVAYIRSGQTIASDFPSADWSDIGLSPVRNQIWHSEAHQIGTEDAGPIKRKFSLKLPKMIQRIREGDEIKFVYDNSNSIVTNFGVRYSSFA